MSVHILGYEVIRTFAIATAALLYVLAVGHAHHTMVNDPPVSLGTPKHSRSRFSPQANQPRWKACTIQVHRQRGTVTTISGPDLTRPDDRVGALVIARDQMECFE